MWIEIFKILLTCFKIGIMWLMSRHFFAIGKTQCSRGCLEFSLVAVLAKKRPANEQRVKFHHDYEWKRVDNYRTLRGTGATQDSTVRGRSEKRRCICMTGMVLRWRQATWGRRTGISSIGMWLFFAHTANFKLWECRRSDDLANKNSTDISFRFT